MPQNRFIRRGLLVAVAAWVTGVVHAAPVSTPFSASVTVLQQLEIKEDANLVFGKIDKPRAGTGVSSFRVLADGSTSITGGVGGAFIGGGHRPGQYDFLGTADQVILANAIPGTCSTNTIALAALELDVDLPAKLPMLNVKLAGSVRVNSASAPGVHTCSYTITAQYQ